MGHWLPLSWLPQEINDTSNTSQTSCDNYGWPTQTAAGSPSQWWVTLSKEVMVRNLRGGQNFCLVSVTHPALWTTAVLWPSLRRQCYYKDHPKSLKESYFWHCLKPKNCQNQTSSRVHTQFKLTDGQNMLRGPPARWNLLGPPALLPARDS